MFQQDRAPAHTAEKTQNIKKSKMTNITTKDMLSPLLPDLNPLDFCVLARFEVEACRVCHESQESIQCAIQELWRNIDERYIERVCAALQAHVERVIETDDDYSA